MINTFNTLGLVNELDDDNNMTPLIKTEECTFAFIKHSNVYVVATTRKNSNISMLFSLLHRICQVAVLRKFQGHWEVKFYLLYTFIISFKRKIEKGL